MAGHRKRQSIASRIADDSSGDEGGDVARGLAAGGGGAMFGGRTGLGMIPANGVTASMDFDPVEELDAGDLEVPVAQDGLEVREWSEALRVSSVNRSGSTLKGPGRGSSSDPERLANLLHAARGMVLGAGSGDIDWTSRNY